MKKYKTLNDFLEGARKEINKAGIKDQTLITLIESKLKEAVETTIDAASIELDIENKYAHPEWGRGWEAAMKWVEGRRIPPQTVPLES